MYRPKKVAGKRKERGPAWCGPHAAADDAERRGGQGDLQARPLRHLLSGQGQQAGRAELAAAGLGKEEREGRREGALAAVPSDWGSRRNHAAADGEAVSFHHVVAVGGGAHLQSEGVLHRFSLLARLSPEEEALANLTVPIRVGQSKRQAALELCRFVHIEEGEQAGSGRGGGWRMTVGGWVADAAWLVWCGASRL